MLLDMQLYMPTQTPLAENDFAFTAKSTNVWLKKIPATTFEAAGAELRDYISKANRLNISSKQRLASMKTLQPISRRIINELQKYLICQSFPLSPRANNAYSLQQSLLTELSIAYKIIIVDSIHNEKRPDNKKLFHCVANAINYVAEQYISCLSTYQQLPTDLWYEISQIYRIAEHQNFHHKKTKVSLIGNQTTIEQVFKHLCALTLITFNKLRQGEAEKICNFLFRNQDLIIFSDRSDDITSNSIYIANLATGKKPTHYIPRELPISHENRFINYQALVQKLVDLSQQPKQPYSYYLKTGELEPELALRLADMINAPSERNDSRIRSEQNVRAVFGLEHILEYYTQVNSINKSSKNKKTKSEELDEALSNILLMPTEYAANTSSSQLFAFDPVDTAADIWNPFETNNTEQIQLHIAEEEKTLVTPMEDEVNDWHLLNYSSSGLCLFFNSKQKYSMRVGEIVSIERPQADQSSPTILLGITRWMQGTTEKTHKLGVELLNKKHSHVYANFKDNNTQDIPAILLQQANHDKNSYSLLLPAGSGLTSTEILLADENNSHLITVGNIIETTSSFTHFEITNISSKSS